MRQLLENKLSNAPETDNFAISFLHLKLRREQRKTTEGGDWITGQLTRLCALLGAVTLISKVF